MGIDVEPASQAIAARRGGEVQLMRPAGYPQTPPTPPDSCSLLHDHADVATCTPRRPRIVIDRPDCRDRAVAAAQCHIQGTPTLERIGGDAREQRLPDPAPPRLQATSPANHTSSSAVDIGGRRERCALVIATSLTITTAIALNQGSCDGNRTCPPWLWSDGRGLVQRCLARHFLRKDVGVVPTDCFHIYFLVEVAHRVAAQERKLFGPREVIPQHL